ncbi:MAG: hypothetical protein ABSG49_05110 [Methanoregula sp.]|jgi:serine phosphatase RsbU (regulator of sigma subunit)
MNAAPPGFHAVQEIISGLLEDIRQFCGTAPQSDDITLVVIRVI